MTPAALDHINSTLEACGFMPTLWECWAVYRSQGAVGSTLMSHAYWTAVGVWWLFYYNGLGQLWTMTSIAVWLAAYSLKTALIVHYRYSFFSGRLEVGPLTPRRENFGTKN